MACMMKIDVKQHTAHCKRVRPTRAGQYMMHVMRRTVAMRHRGLAILIPIVWRASNVIRMLQAVLQGR
jgi:hypothetical protein